MSIFLDCQQTLPPNVAPLTNFLLDIFLMFVFTPLFLGVAIHFSYRVKCFFLYLLKPIFIAVYPNKRKYQLLLASFWIVNKHPEDLLHIATP